MYHNRYDGFIKMTKQIKVDDGYVELMSYTSDPDLAVVNAARVSFGKIKDALDDKDVKLINYLARHKHMSPFRHAQFTFRIHTSEVVCRQLYKHQVGCGFTSGEFRESATTWNEISGRYVELDSGFHTPTHFRTQHQSNKQASLPDSIVEENELAKVIYENAISDSQAAYQALLKLGVCKEQARMVLPVSFMNTLVWTASLEAIANFVKLRDHEGAQWEIRKLAVAVRDLVKEVSPVSLEALV
jgi:thymidylate synthase (FAD)